MPEHDARAAELARNLAAVRARLGAACVAAGRSIEELTLVVVTKTYPAADVLRLAALGVGDVGENRDQEAAPKAEQVAAGAPSLRWHFIGQLQRNKCRSVVRYAHMVHSVDSVRLAQALSRAATSHAAESGAGDLQVLVQASLDGDPSRGGAVPDDPSPVHGAPRGSHSPDPDVCLDRVLAAVADAGGLALRGLMAVAPLDWPPDRAFETLAALAARVRQSYPQATVLSAGMSGDVEQAIRYGATHVRLGSAVLGQRGNLR